MGIWGNFRIGATFLGGTSIIFLLSACTFSEPPAATPSEAPSIQTSPAPATSSAASPVSPTPIASQSLSAIPSSTLPATQGTSSARGSVVVELANTGLPKDSNCQASAQNTAGVTSGGGGLTGAEELLGTVSLSNATEFNVLPGVYDIRVHCTTDDGTWQAREQEVSVRTEEDTNLVLELRQTP